MTLIKDLIEIPERVYKGDFVLKLTEGVDRADETLDTYVVTPELVDNFDQALGFIHSALTSQSSKATYLDGSFGAGKSHFMAVLHLLLAGHPRARALPELAPVVAKHGAWLQERKFLLVPYHMIAARSLESALLGRYVEHVRKLHPDAPIPGVFVAEKLFNDARTLRARMGDAGFFAELNRGDSPPATGLMAPFETVAQGGRPPQGERNGLTEYEDQSVRAEEAPYFQGPSRSLSRAPSRGPGQASAVPSEGSGWGDLEQAWDAERFDAALAAPPGSEERSALVADLVGTLFTAYADAMQGQAEAYVPLEQGLSILSRHARDLGYDALILFLDELVLWLASHAADNEFVTREIQKVAKLVESQRADRPVPIVSFIARQRDLRQLVGEHVPGSEQLAFMDILKWWEGRLHNIGLLDRNLPAIAEKRVLKPKSEAARTQINAAFDELARGRKEVIETLLTADADLASFRQVYPFSPALVTTLVAVSSVLQRERTAIKMMLQLLVSQRQSLELGQLIPVGDLFDVIAGGDEAFSEGMRQHFENARRLYAQKLLPVLEAEHRMRADAVRELPAADPKATAFRNDDRLVKTLLLSALAPEVGPLKDLTAARLAALNHGTFKSPIAGREGQMVLARLRKWAAEVGEIKIGEGQNPIVTLQLSGVDTESILEKARINDNPGERQRKVRELLFRELGIENRDELFLAHEFLWRNTRRTCEVLFANVRSLPDESLRAREDRWKLVIDFPFDESGHTPRDDLARVQTFREQNPSSPTLVWIPSFFSRAAQKDLGTLVVLDHVLTGERFADYASHLTGADRLAARGLLENRRSQLRERVKAYLEGAYGVTTAPGGSVDQSHDLGEHVQSLEPTFAPRLPVGRNLGAALQNLLEQTLDHQYPAHPQFEAEVKPGLLRKVLTEVERAIGDPQRRILVDRTMRPLMLQIAVPLRLGEMGETHFVLGDFWLKHFKKKLAQEGGALTAGKLRAWTDDPEPRGLLPWVQNLLVILYALSENCTFMLHGGPAGEVSLDALRDELVLEQVALPSQEDWDRARERAAHVFGLTASALRSATNVAKLAAEIVAQATAARAPLNNLCTRLRERMAAFGLDPEKTARLGTATAAQALVEAVVQAGEDRGGGRGVIDAVARAHVHTSAVAMGRSVSRAAEVCGGLEGLGWEVFDGLAKLEDERRAGAEAIRSRVREALAADEYATALIPALHQAQTAGIELLTRVVRPVRKDDAPPSTGLRAGFEEVAQGGRPPQGERNGLTEYEDQSVRAEEAPFFEGPSRSPNVPQPGTGASEGSGIVVEGSQNDLDAAGAADLLAGLEARLREDPARRLDITWKIVKR